ncbi:MAG: site-specific integrase [Lachnospiraceae bacterium]|nr:site-specific integrase [Lachnospiraceae bacterium]
MPKNNEKKSTSTEECRQGNSLPLSNLCEKATFCTIGQMWLNSNHMNSKESTVVKYHNIFRNHILPDIGDCLITEFNTELFENFAVKKQKNGRLDGKGGLSPKTVKDIISVIREILRFAHAKGIEAPACLDSFYIKVREKPLNIINRSDQDKLEQYLIKDCTPKNIGILIGLYMGLRIGEICALKWEDIYLEDGIMGIHHTMQRLQNLSGDFKSKTKVIITSPKSESSNRSIPIPDFLLSLLKCQSGYTSDCFFLTGSSSSYIEPRSYQNYFKKILQQNGIKYTNFHVLRHTFATQCVENGFDTKTLSEILGHSSVNITLNRYVHASMEMKRKNMSKIQLISAQLPTTSL